MGGVNFLETFVKIVKPDLGLEKVNLKEVIRNARVKNKRRPVFVFDSHNLMNLLSKGREIENIFGGRHWICLEHLDKIFSQLASFGADLVFFFNGSARSDERHLIRLDRWRSKQHDKFDKIDIFMNMLKQGNPTTVKDIVENRQAMATLGYFKKLYGIVKFTCEKYGTVYISENNECHQEIASYAKKHDVFGVFANNSNFLIFPGNWRHFSTEQLSIDVNGVLSTLEYPRAKLRNKLNLTDEQLAFFASLCGNKFTKYEMKEFNRTVQISNETLKEKIRNTYNIGNVVRRNAVFNSDRSIDDWTLSFMQKIRLDRSPYSSLGDIEGFENQLKESVKFYHDLVNIDELVVFKDNLRYKIEQQIGILYTPYFIDLTDENCARFWKSLLYQLQRYVGAILSLNPELKDGRKISLKTKKSVDEEYNFFEVDPIYADFLPSQGIFTINANNQLELLKWLSCLDHIETFKLEDFTDNMKIDIAVLTSLYDQNLITLNELNVLLWTIVAYHEKVIPRDIAIDIDSQRVNYRAFCIAQMFMTLHGYITNGFEICKMNQESMMPINFDSVFFHIEYLRFIVDKEDMRSLGASNQSFDLIKRKLHEMLL